MVLRYCLGMIMSVSILMIGRGAATPVRVENLSLRKPRFGGVHRAKAGFGSSRDWGNAFGGVRRDRLHQPHRASAPSPLRGEGGVRGLEVGVIPVAKPTAEPLTRRCAPTSPLRGEVTSAPLLGREAFACTHTEHQVEVLYGGARGALAQVVVDGDQHGLGAGVV